MSLRATARSPAVDGDDPIATSCALDVLGERMRLVEGGAPRQAGSVRDSLVSIAAQSLVALERHDRARESRLS